MTPAPILIVGRNGQLARCLQELAAAQELAFVAMGREQLDLEKHDRVDCVVGAVAPSVIINAAAYTAVDRAESEKETAFSINRDGAASLAAAAARRDIPFLHVSTDYVFDGSKPTAYREGDVPAPINVYGASKLAGETAVLAACPSATIVRTAWVYSSYGSNFVRTMRKLAGAQPVVRVVDDQQGNPTSAHDLAAALLQIAQQARSDRRAVAGVFHLAGEGETNWHGFASAIFDGLGRRGLPVPRLEAIGTRDYPTAARRPANSRLDSSSAERALGIRLPAWRPSLEVCLDRIVAQGESRC